MSHKILIIGATGNVGSHLVKLLAEKDEQVKAATRKPEVYTTQPKVEATAFEFDDPTTYAPALEGADRVFLLARSADPEPQKILIPFIDQAKASGVNHIVLMTAMGVDQAEELGLRKVEKHLIVSGMAYTILRPNWFMQNFNPGFILPSIKENGGIYLPADDAKLSFIDTRDISAVAAAALTGDGHKGKEYTLTGGQALSYAEAAGIISAASRREIKYVAISDDDARDAMKSAGWSPQQVEFMLGLFYTVRQGWSAPISPAVTSVLGREPISFEQFARDNADAWK
jgi:uncharacterized protein YbjT (DUF2867 family)